MGSIPALFYYSRLQWLGYHTTPWNRCPQILKSPAQHITPVLLPAVRLTPQQINSCLGHVFFSFGLYPSKAGMCSDKCPQVPPGGRLWRHHWCIAPQWPLVAISCFQLFSQRSQQSGRTDRAPSLGYTSKCIAESLPVTFPTGAHNRNKLFANWSLSLLSVLIYHLHLGSCVNKGYCKVVGFSCHHNLGTWILSRASSSCSGCHQVKPHPWLPAYLWSKGSAGRCQHPWARIPNIPRLSHYIFNYSVTAIPGYRSQRTIMESW